MSFIIGANITSAGNVLDLFKSLNFSAEGSSELKREQDSFIFFKRLLGEMEGKTSSRSVFVPFPMLMYSFTSL